MKKLCLLAITVATVICCHHSILAQQKPDAPTLLLRVPHTEPDNAVATLRTQPGLRVELVAAEPLVRDPVAIDFDESGRMFVVEFREYNQRYADRGITEQGVVKMLTDTDRDGRYDTASVYVAGLSFPTALACYDGGVFVGAAPDILYCKDTDGDGKSDIRRVVFTGFGVEPQRAGQAALNSFRWGLDNKFHVCTNFSGGLVRRADDAGSPVINVRNRSFLFDPRTLEFSASSGGGQNGLGVDDWGNEYRCKNSDPFISMMYDERYLARNPYLKAPSSAVRISGIGKYTKIFRVSPDEPWRVIRMKRRAEGTYAGSIEGEGRVSGYFTAATGVTIYRGDALPKDYRGDAFIGEPANNLVFHANLTTSGLGISGSRADADAEFLASTDNWFRPVQFSNAPDGALYVVDMYRELIEGAGFLPNDVVKALTVTGGVKRGRVYRVFSAGHQLRKPPRLGESSTARLVQLLEHPNGWHRDTAARLLYQRQDKSAVEALKKLATTSSSPRSRMIAWHALNGLGSLDEETMLTALDEPDPRARLHALRLAEPFAQSSQKVRNKIILAAGDSNIQTRYQAAFSLGAFTSADRNEALLRLIREDGGNPWMRLAVLSSLNEGRGAIFAQLARDDSYRQSKTGADLLVTLAGQIGAAARKDELAALVDSLNRLPASESAMASRLVRVVFNSRSRLSRETLLAGSTRASSIYETMLASARKNAFDSQAPDKTRVAAIRTLQLAEFDTLTDSMEQWFESTQPAPVQSAALETLSSFNRSEVAQLILNIWTRLTPQLQAQANDVIFSREKWIVAFLDAVQAKRLTLASVDPARLQLLKSHPDESIRNRAAKLLSQTNLRGRAEVVAAYHPALETLGDAARGKVVFGKICAACHRLENVGTAVGADLKAIRDRGMEGVLLNILDPNRKVEQRYISYVVFTADGRSHTGMITSETANSLTLRRPDGSQVSILRLDIEQMRSTGLSFMPEGLEKQIDVKGMADLLAYLNSIR